MITNDCYWDELSMRYTSWIMILVTMTYQIARFFYGRDKVSLFAAWGSPCSSPWPANGENDETPMDLDGGNLDVFQHMDVLPMWQAQ